MIQSAQLEHHLSLSVSIGIVTLQSSSLVVTSKLSTTRLSGPQTSGFMGPFVNLSRGAHLYGFAIASWLDDCLAVCLETTLCNCIIRVRYIKSAFATPSLLLLLQAAVRKSAIIITLLSTTDDDRRRFIIWTRGCCGGRKVRSDCDLCCYCVAHLLH